MGRLYGVQSNQSVKAQLISAAKPWPNPLFILFD